mmetsp:Transcript_29117/g.66912  ORF Transcript_29117/g.66912 Transcript_29117/m.66912 type:complete len:149 (-) Transcript_29117:180-626(-)
MVEIAVSELVQAEEIADPGAKTSTHEPWFEKDDRASEEVVDPTVIASGAEAGELKHAFSLSFPAATTTDTPAACAAATAALTDEEAPPPRDMEITERPGREEALLTAHSMPAITPAFEPEPPQLSTCTATIVAAFATPYWVPAIVPAQ